MSMLSDIKRYLAEVLPDLMTADPTTGEAEFKSNATIEAKITDVVGTVADTFNLERQTTLDDIQTALANQKVTTKEYYRRIAVKFQWGDTLQYDPINQGGYYDPVIPENQIIKQAYIIGDFPTYTLLVNALDSDGHLRVLTTAELDSFNTYFDAFRPLGLTMVCGSLPVAQITVPNLVVYVRAGAEAQGIADGINAAFIAYESVLRPNNTVSITEIVDIMQSVDGVISVYPGGITATEVNTAGVPVPVTPVEGIFSFTNGAFTFATEVTTAHIRVL